MSAKVIGGDCLESLRQLPDASVHCCVTSPPYFGLRDYGTGEWEGGDPECAHRVGGQVQDTKAPGAITTGQRPGVDASRCKDCGAARVDKQLGLEATPDEYVARLVEVFAEVKRVLRGDGTLWLNLGDSYNAYNGGAGPGSKLSKIQTEARPKLATGYGLQVKALKPKDLLMIPARVALALRADGWYLRSEIIWAKPNPMPESVTDRPTKAHEQVFLLSKSPRYFYDADAIREPNQDYEFASSSGRVGKGSPPSPQSAQTLRGATTRAEKFATYNPAGRNKRSVWTVSTQPYPDAHFATFPPKLIEPMILAGCPRDACGVCGAPWERRTEREDQGFDGSRYGERAVEASGGAITGGTARSTLGSSNGKLTGSQRTLGFAATCEHDDRSGTGIVLDPFAGSGTTLQVALELGRDAIGIELNPEYVALIERRLAHVVERPDGLDSKAMMSAKRERSKIADAGQASIFDVLD